MIRQKKVKKKLIGPFLIGAALASVWLLQSPAGAAVPAPPSIEDLAWMAGNWVSEGAIRTEESWTPPGGGTLIGMGRTIRGGKTIFFEYLRIESRADGIYYVAHPKARPGTDFRLTHLEAGKAVFENPAHDFPKRITYRLEADGTLVARVEGDARSAEPPQDIRYRRVREPGP